MLSFDCAGVTCGIVGCAVGAAFATLVAEQLFASGCQFLLSLTSAGRIAPDLPDEALFVVIDEALRDEGTSYHYAPPDQRVARAEPRLARLAAAAIARTGLAFRQGAVWTTDAPFRETSQAIEAAARDGLLAVEMESAALYAFATASGASVLCLAHVTNRMAQVEGDFEKGEDGGAGDALRVIASVVHGWRQEDATFGQARAARSAVD